MKIKYTIRDAILGTTLWKNLTDNSDKVLILIIPEYEKQLIEILSQALKEYLVINRNQYEEIKVIYSNVQVEKELKTEIDFPASFREMSQKQMNRLMSFALLSAKQYGVICNRNIKVISLNLIYGGQLLKIYSNSFCDPKRLVREMMLERE